MASTLSRIFFWFMMNHWHCFMFLYLMGQLFTCQFSGEMVNQIIYCVLHFLTCKSDCTFYWFFSFSLTADTAIEEAALETDLMFVVVIGELLDLLWPPHTSIHLLDLNFCVVLRFSAAYCCLVPWNIVKLPTEGLLQFVGTWWPDLLVILVKPPLAFSSWELKCPLTVSNYDGLQGCLRRSLFADFKTDIPAMHLFLKRMYFNARSAMDTADHLD